MSGGRRYPLNSSRTTNGTALEEKCIPGSVIASGKRPCHAWRNQQNDAAHFDGALNGGDVDGSRARTRAVFT